MNQQYTLIGHPLGHSMSPWIHERLFRLAGVQASYTLTDIAPETLRSSVEELRSLCGFNVTIPYKTDIIPFLSQMDETAERYHSVNTVAVRGSGELHGFNTDCTGFLASVGDIHPGDRILLVGCGGVGRMMATECYLRGARLTITERDIPRAHALMEELTSRFTGTGGRIRVLDGAPPEEFDWLMNATPVGMFPRTEGCPVSDAVIEGCSKVFDVIYNPTETQLIRKAREMGKDAVGGAAMLVRQAAAAQSIWLGCTFSEDDLTALIRDMEAEVSRLFPVKEGQG